MSYYKHHIFFCLNERKNGEACCARHDAQAAFDHCKASIKAAGLDRCAGGPGVVVYPDETWYSFVDQQDIDEIVESHLKNGQVVERLLLPPNIGR